LEDIPRVWGGLGRFVKDFPRGFGGATFRESLSTRAPQGSGSVFWVAREGRGGELGNKQKVGDLCGYEDLCAKAYTGL
jgi:hypothetical protein